ncbi:MAG: VCBS domain-containing protein [Pirellulales bacterium]
MHRRQFQRNRSGTPASTQTIDDVFTYTVTDAGGLTSTTQITVTIHGQNDTPNDILATPLMVDENAANGTSVGSVAAQDVDAGETYTYSSWMMQDWIRHRYQHWTNHGRGQLPLKLRNGNSALHHCSSNRCTRCIFQQGLPGTTE